jgi:hypothetical protein
MNASPASSIASTVAPRCRENLRRPQMFPEGGEQLKQARNPSIVRPIAPKVVRSHTSVSLMSAKR